MSDNQLLAEAEQLPDLDEFAGLSIADIAAAIVHSPPDSEDQNRAVAAIRARAPSRHHNRPPLHEMLDEELASSLGRQEQLLAIARKAVIIDAESAEKVVNLAAQMKALEDDLEDARKKRVQPYLDGQRLINERFKGVAWPLTLARQGENGKGGLRAMLTQWDDKLKAEAAAERRRAEEEARRREEAAEAARRAAEDKAAQGRVSVDAELEAAAAEEEAERARQRAAAIRPEPIRAHLGQVNRRREIVLEIANYREAITWLLRASGLKSQLEQAVFGIIDRHLRSLGVATVERGITIPGCRIGVEAGAANIRR